MAAPADPRDPTGTQHVASLLVWWLVLAGVVAALLIVGLLTVSSLSSSGSSSGDTKLAGAAARKLPPYWIVKPGDTYSQIAQKTGLSTDQLERFNPRTDPTTIVPGQRIKLRMRVPPRPLGPRFWTVRSGQSFGSIAAETGKPIARLIKLNPKLKPSALQVGDRVRLRR